MIECKDYQLEISALLDGESDPATALELLEHVATCRACGDVVREFRAAQARIDEAFALADPVGSDVERGSPDVVPIRPRHRGPVRHWAWGIAATVVLAVGGYVAMDRVGQMDATGIDGDTEIVVRLGEDPGGMSDDRFMEITAELLRADRSYRDEMFAVLEAVRTGDPRDGESATERVTEPGRSSEAGLDPTLQTAVLD